MQHEGVLAGDRHVVAGADHHGVAVRVDGQGVGCSSVLGSSSQVRSQSRVPLSV